MHSSNTFIYTCRPIYNHVVWVWRLWHDNVVNRYSRCLLLYGSSCCSKCLSEIRPRLGTKTHPAAQKSLSQAALAGNGVFNLINVCFRDGHTSRPELTCKGLRAHFYYISNEQSNEVESRYLQEKVTSLQVESTVYKFTL